MRPLVYGYLRVRSGARDAAVRRTERLLAHVAEREGYCYVTTFHEYDDGSRSSFYALLTALRQAEARYVIMPSLDHLSGHRLLRGHLLAMLEQEAGARVLTLGRSRG